MRVRGVNPRRKSRGKLQFMQLGKVKEQLWLEQTAGTWKGYRLVSVVVAKADGTTGAEIIAGDSLGARVGETVLVGSSSRVRDRVLGVPGAPIKSVILAIIDKVDWERERKSNRYLAQSPMLQEVEE